jgi:hypothetical protein
MSSTIDEVNMTMFDEVKAKLQSMPLSEITKVSVLLNIPLPTLHNIRYGKSKNPGVQTVQALHDHFRGKK